jgi:steroid 5-alpha reductase family enzyme
VDLACLLLSLCGVAAGLSLGMTGAWLAWRQTGNSGWVDTIWTFSVGTAGIVSTLASGAALAGPGLRQEVVMALAAAWSLRLGLHIARRSRRIEDDPGTPG